MDSYYLTKFLLLGSLILAVFAGIQRFRHLDTAMRLLWMSFCVTLIGESVAFIWAMHYQNNLEVYSVSSILDILLTGLYFNYSIGIFKKHKTGYIIAVISVLVGLLCNFYFQPPQNFPSYFLHFEALVIISMAMFSLAYMLQKPGYIVLRHEPHFWVCTVLIFFWSITYFNWSLFEFYANRPDKENNLILLSMFFVNFITNTAIAVIFFRLPKMKAHGQ